MPKRLLPVLLLVCSAAFAGCGDGDDGDDTATDTPSETSAAPSESPSGSGSSGSSAPASDVTCDYPADQLPASKDNEPPPSTPTVSGVVTATVETSIGAMTFSLDADRTPCTVNSFVSLAEQNYFNGTHCHRMTTSGIYVLQCGDPTASGSGGPGYTIQDEVDGSETYGPGVLAMAKTAAPDSGGSQFFIVYDDSPLPPEYTVFGSVDEATVQAIVQLAAGGTDESNGPGDGRPLTDVDIESVSIG